jgi:hypothetical protein
MPTRTRTTIEQQKSGPRTFGPGKNDTSKFSTVTDKNDSGKLEVSKPAGQRKKSKGPAQKIRSEINAGRDSHTLLGEQKSANVVES